MFVNILSYSYIYLFVIDLAVTLRANPRLLKHTRGGGGSTRSMAALTSRLFRKKTTPVRHVSCGHQRTIMIIIISNGFFFILPFVHISFKLHLEHIMYMYFVLTYSILNILIRKNIPDKPMQMRRMNNEIHGKLYFIFLLQFKVMRFS